MSRGESEAMGAIGDEMAVDDLRQLALEAAQRFARGLVLDELAIVVVPSGARVHGLDAGADAMNVAPPADGFFQIAGHNVYMETADGGQTWQDVPNNLPGLDLHAFIADPVDPSHAWAFAVGFGLFETTDKGRTWELRQPGGWGALTSFVESGKTILVGVGSTGLTRSDDGGRTWTAVGQPTGQIASLAASADGAVIYAGTTTGVGRSTDAGRTWTATPLKTVGVTVAVYPKNPDVVAVVDDETRFFRRTGGSCPANGCLPAGTRGPPSRHGLRARLRDASRDR